ncbi:DEAD/DEAH box helicase [Litorivicinus sp.]|nr:DEAD/DEAH box helicase [Litorivicinus sp.]
MSSKHSYTLTNFSQLQTEELKRYIEAQYHIRNTGLIRDRRSLLDQKNSIANEPFLETSKFYKSVKGYDSARIGTTASLLLSKLSANPSETGVMPTPYTHQIDALESFIQNNKNIVVATGTGSGKTEAFLYPLLSNLIELEKQAPTTDASMKALILYPMNALVADQTTRLRKILGSRTSSQVIRSEIGRPLRFGNYTGGTSYAGVPSEERNRENIKPLRDLYKVDAQSPEEIKYRDALKASNRIPAKADIRKFLDQAEFTTEFKSIIDPNDAELIFRGEMQVCPPDIMVTNYSMLEYMLLRPIEQTIFDRTQEWLASNQRNQFTIVLDEAHMYTGTTGSEVSLLLRRLINRIGAKQTQIRFIVTSASLGDNDDKIREIANKLTGLDGDSFEIIYEQVEKPIKSGKCSEDLASLLGKISPDEIYDIQLQNEHSEISEDLQDWANELASNLKIKAFEGTVGSFKQWIGENLLKTEVFGLARTVLENPRTPSELSKILFPDQTNQNELLDSLVSLGSIGQTSSSLLLPIRAHFMYRGLPGLFVCANPLCGEDDAPVGKMYADKRTICDCGSRVYELYTHRTCGSAYIKAHWSVSEGDAYDNQLLHPTGASLDHEELAPVFLCVDDFSAENSNEYSINPRTGKISKGVQEGSLSTSIPISEEAFKEHVIKDYSSATKAWTYSHCPCCGEATVKKDAQENESDEFESSIMDLATKGEDPFTYLVREQFKLQPPTEARSDRNPNQGRKVLLFSDGRQKAARIAKRLPETIQKDVFRIYIIKAYKWLQTTNAAKKLTDADDGILDIRSCKNTLNPVILYHGLLEVCLKPRKVFFEGADRNKYTEHLDAYSRGREVSESDLPQSYFQLLAEILCTSNYNLTELAIAGVRPSPRVFNKQFLKKLEEENIATSDIQTLEAFVSKRLRDYLSVGAISEIDGTYLRKALPFIYDLRGRGASYKLTPNKKSMFSSRKASSLLGNDAKKINDCFKDVFLKSTGSDPGDHFNLQLKHVALAAVDLDENWYQCSNCLYLTDILAGNRRCPACGSAEESIHVFDQDSPYFKARKLFWRNPVTNVLRNNVEELFIDVGEHTAQLNYRDKNEKIIPTVAKNELRFQGLLDPSDENHSKPLDILSSTTTMEVGIDIGGLIAVAMRNVPPQRQNYQQRAGRAGRRGSAFSTVLTFCQNGSHDSHYFKNPEQIISGRPAPMHLEPMNKSLAKRHLLSSLLSAYFNSVGFEASHEKGRSNDIFAHLGRLEDFMGDTPPCMSHLKSWIQSPSNAELINNRSDWYLKLFGQTSVISDIEPLLDALEPKLEKILAEHTKRASESHRANPVKAKLMDVLFHNADLPSYAFPLDLVEFQLFSFDSKMTIEEAPSSYIGNAISESAPGRVLVIDKNTYQIGSILGSSVADIEKNKAASIFDPLASKSYEHCNSCGTLHDIYAETKECCATPTLKTIKVVQPRYVISREQTNVSVNLRDAVFTKANDPQIIGEPSNKLDKKPHKRLTGCNNLTYTANGVKFAHINANNSSSGDHEPKLFTVCSQCGKSSPPYAEDDIVRPHKRDYPTRPEKGGKFAHETCNGTPEKVALGHELVTDMSAIQFTLPDAMKKPRGKVMPPELKIACTSLCVAIIQAFAKLQDIDERGVGYGIRVAGDEGYDIELYFFDDAQGGAGYANKVIPSFYETLKANPNFNAIDTLDDCDCDNSCYNCLSSYQNRFVDPLLNRFMGVALARTLLSGNLEQDGDEKYLQRLARRLTEEIRQVGGNITGERSFTLNGKARSFDFIPSLSEPQSRDSEHFSLRPIDIALKLPNIIDELLQ